MTAPRALLSVSDKRGIVGFAQGLVDLGWEIVSTGGTAAALRKAGVPVTTVEEVTGFPELLDGRVKTLHPRVHAGLLARRDQPEHVAALREHGIAPFDLVAVNLYPFQMTVAQPGVAFEDAVENIDVGGPSMLRSAAKNHDSVIPVSDPTDYPRVLAMLSAGGVPAATRHELAAKVFAHTADYDAAIARYLTPRDEGLPRRLALAMERVQPLRYGENPEQRAALYVTEEPRGVRDLRQRQGKELSFNNLLDIDGATWAVACWPARPACCIVKHTTPCGIAVGASAVEAFRKARSTDPVSAYGSVVAFNTVVDAATAEAMRDLFVEVVVAPSFHAEALAVFAAKKALRVVELPVGQGAGSLDFKRVRGGFLVQDRFVFDPNDAGWRTATARAPTEAELGDLHFAWAAVAAVKSNAILLARGEMAIGIGAGQMSRVDASFLAVHKARQQGHDPAGAVLASDAYFPFADGVEEAAAAGITAIVQPGGSMRDAEVIAAADRHGLAMVLTGRRQFRH
ncbi:MAG TPA: bifunctional phosphoribosylaminoimidazolecarboxamide formyltransferase/IMP cyclohydrolase [Gemmatimonadales bacterium]|nr:bifunctional phosphoribosylaminoimidazolecarboxamide formyltransferase/IMP cyclohydrolase [Gemmatimonadales bacterium]